MFHFIALFLSSLWLKNLNNYNIYNICNSDNEKKDLESKISNYSLHYNFVLAYLSYFAFLTDLVFLILWFLLSILSQLYPLGIANGSEISASGHCCGLLDDLLLLLRRSQEDADEDVDAEVARLSPSSGGLVPLFKYRGLDKGV